MIEAIAVQRMGRSWHFVPYRGKTSFKKVRLVDAACIRRVLEHLRNQDYVVLLGPPYSDKTWLMRDIAQALRIDDFSHPIYLDLWQVRSDDESTFFTSLAQLVSQTPGLAACLPSDTLINARDFQVYLESCLQTQGRHLTLLIDHLQALPHDLVHSLLLALRSIHVERQMDAASQFGVVVTGGMILANFSTGPTSPFNVAKAVLVEPLNAKQSWELALATLEQHGWRASEEAIAEILRWTGGDYYLLPLLCARCAEAAQNSASSLVTIDVVRRAAERLCLADEARAPVRKAIEIIEEDPSTLLDVLSILDHGDLAPASARQTITRSGANRLQLCGAVVFANGRYRIKNRVYQEALVQHFQPAQVGYVLRMNSRWPEAIGYLAPRLTMESGGAARANLLEAIVQSIYAADDLGEAYDALAQGLQLGFGLAQVNVYQADLVHNELRLVHPQTENPKTPAVIGLDDPGCVEAQTFRYRNYALRRSARDVRLVATLTPENQPIGLVTVDRYTINVDQRELPSGLLELLRFLRQAAAAIENVMLHTTYNEIGRAVLSAGGSPSPFEPVLQAVAGALGGDFANLYLLDASETRLEMVAGVGRLWDRRWQARARFEVASSHAAAQAWRALKTVATYGAYQDLDKAIVDHFNLYNHIRAFTPLSAGGSRLGVLEVGFQRHLKSLLTEKDRQSLALFADQVAIAVYNMQLLRRTDEALARRVDALKRLSEVSKAVSSTLDLAAVLDRVIRNVQALFNASAATIWKYDPESRRLTVQETTIDDPGYRATILTDDGATGQSITTQRPVQIADIQHLSDEALKRRAVALGVHSMVAAPLISRGLVLGAINVYKSTPHRFSQDEEELLSAFAAQAAIAIYNARQYRNLEMDSINLAYAILHRIGHAGDILFQLQRAGKLAATGGPIDETLAHISQRIRSLMDLHDSLERMVAVADIQRKQVDLRGVVEEALRNAVICAGVVSDLDLPQDPVWVYGDAALLRDAIQSVVENACEAVRETGAVSVKLTRPDDLLASLHVNDNGPGIPEEIRSRIFELGFSTKATSERGRGQGLYTSRAIVHRHEGTIQVRSQAGQGAEFIITLPILAEREE